MPRTVLVEAAIRAPPWLASKPTEDSPVYVISSNHGLTAHVSYWNKQSETVWGFPSEYRTLNLLRGAECAPVSKKNLAVYFHETL